MDELATDAREAAEKALAKVVEEFEASGKEPKFDPAQWAEQLSKVWDVIRRMKARGIELELPQADPIPPPDES
ncbi:MAG: hypothetical protein C0501_07135 [Isosphaera sp.]|nr:hypothetical protein [Isosphaera sp.]